MIVSINVYIFKLNSSVKLLVEDCFGVFTVSLFLFLFFSNLSFVVSTIVFLWLKSYRTI